MEKYSRNQFPAGNDRRISERLERISKSIVGNKMNLNVSSALSMNKDEVLGIGGR